ncbi:MAG: hypothetical protein Q7T73_15370 [Beijerinckiaceae bacterium]|nr:hypothetical protein [Beijerinckiaceae bacterium]
MVSKDSTTAFLLILVDEDRAECTPWPVPEAPADDNEQMGDDR